MRRIAALCLLLLAPAATGAAGRTEFGYISFSDLRAMPASAELPAPPKPGPGKAPAPLKAAEARPAKLTLCFLRKVEKDECVYACRDGREYRTPVRLPEPGDHDTPVIACSQVVIPF